MTMLTATRIKVMSTANGKPTAATETGHLAVRCRGVTKDFGTGDSKVQVLRGVDMEVFPGEMTLLVGPSGCGKTTLLSVIAGTLDPTAGDVDVLDRSLGTMSGRAKVRFRGENIGFVFQQFNLLPSLTAAENASVPLIINGRRRADAIAKAEELLKSVDLGNRLKAYPSQLSGGQQQRVAIARALVHEPRLLVCDEPTSALDAQSGRTIMELLRKVAVQPNRAVIVVTHDSRVYEFADRIISMSDGAIEKVEVKKAGELLRPDH